MNTTVTYGAGENDFPKAEEMYTRAVNGYERSPGKEHHNTKNCAKNFDTFFGREAEIYREGEGIGLAVSSLGDGEDIYYRFSELISLFSPNKF